MNQREILELKNIIREIKNLMIGFNSSFYIAEERHHELEVSKKKISRMKDRKPKGWLQIKESVRCIVYIVRSSKLF